MTATGLFWIPLQATRNVLRAIRFVTCLVCRRLMFGAAVVAAMVLLSGRAAIVEDVFDSLAVAESCRLHGQFELAVRHYERALRHSRRQSIAIYAGLGDCYEQLRMPEQAAAYHDSAIELPARCAADYIAQGYAFIDLKLYHRAGLAFAEAIRRNRDSGPAYCGRGLVHFRLHEYEQAIQDLNYAIRIDPSYPLAYVAMGMVRQELSQFDEANYAYDIAILLDPKYVRAYYQRGLIHFELKQYSQATDDLSRAIELSPDCIAAHMARAGVYHAMHRPDLSAHDYRELLRIHDKQPPLKEAYHGNSALDSKDARMARHSIHASAS